MYSVFTEAGKEQKVSMHPANKSSKGAALSPELMAAAL